MRHKTECGNSWMKAICAAFYANSLTGSWAKVQALSRLAKKLQSDGQLATLKRVRHLRVVVDVDLMADGRGGCKPLLGLIVSLSRFGTLSVFQQSDQSLGYGARLYFNVVAAANSIGVHGDSLAWSKVTKGKEAPLGQV